MSQVETKRTPTRVDLESYNKILELATYSMSVCKPKQKKDSRGVTRDSPHHVPMRYAKIGDLINTTITEIGAMILEANAIYVNSNLNAADRKANYDERIRLQTIAIALTYRVEHCIRVLHDHRPFADSTITWWMHLLVDARKSTVAWKDSDVRKRRDIK